MSLTMNAATTAPATKFNNQIKQLKEVTFLPNVESTYFLQGVLEGFIDGILILTEQKELVHANQAATRICNQFAELEHQETLIPAEIWRICESLIESRDLFFNQKIVLESEFSPNNSINLRIRARWLKLEQIRRPCLLVTLEDRYQSLQRMVNNDTQQFNLTPREAEVWLLYRTNHSYKEIADKLYITLNTVKKHMKNIHAKRKAICEEEI